MSADGGRDLILIADPAEKGTLVQKDRSVTLEGELCFVRQNRDGKTVHVAIANGTRVTADGLEVTNDKPTALREWHMEMK
jgi:hypothetical protein